MKMKRVQKIREDLARQVAFAREARARESEDGRYIPQFIAPELLDAIAVMLAKSEWADRTRQLGVWVNEKPVSMGEALETTPQPCSLTPTFKVEDDSE